MKTSCRNLNSLAFAIKWVGSESCSVKHLFGNRWISFRIKIKKFNAIIQQWIMYLMLHVKIILWYVFEKSSNEKSVVTQRFKLALNFWMIFKNNWHLAKITGSTKFSSLWKIVCKSWIVSITVNDTNCRLWHGIDMIHSRSRMSCIKNK